VAPAELDALMRSTVPHALLDVRERGTYERGHIFRATSLPRRLLGVRLPVLVTAAATPLVLCDDEGGDLARLAASEVGAMGYRDVQVLEGGLAGWRSAGLPLVQGVNVPSKVFGERALHERGTPQISPSALKAKMDARARMLIVDARTPEEYARGCIPGAISVPGAELVLRIGDLVADEGTPIVVHCGGRTRSYIGAESLREMKLPNPVVALENGTMGWQLAGFELERGAARRAPSVSARSAAAAASVAQRVARRDAIRFLAAGEVLRLWQRRAEQNLYLADVRTAEEYAAGHAAGAIWAPGGQAIQATDDYFAVRGASFVFVCDGNARSVMTASWFLRMGFPDVAVLEGGLAAWVESGGAVESGHPVRIPFGYEVARAAVPRIGVAELAAMMKADGAPALLNVDASDVYAKGHVPGAAWICASRIEACSGAVLPRDRRIVVSCEDGVMSTMAAQILGRLGYGACVLEGGTRAWRRAGRPIEHGATKLADVADDVVPKPYDRGIAAMRAYLSWEEALNADGTSPVELIPPVSREERAG